ncbi:MAG: hypothetical protein JOZ75_01680 [Candidatus Dormibacteraeota bacterium]|nr:hypothetical protein [Candidatus Dormibacteraeota bacterium]
MAAVAAVPFLPRSVAADDSQGSPTTLHGRVLVGSAPPGSKGPDDISVLSVDGVDRDRPVLWTAYQNGINPDGTPGTPGGPTQSTVAGYDARTGELIKTIAVTGKADGLRADTAHHRLVVTVNEDANSTMDVINVATGSVTQFSYSPNPESASGNGGTDSISFWHGEMYVSHSNPDATTQAAVYRVSLDWSTHIASLTALFNDDSSATDAVTGTTAALALMDPDTTAVVPGETPRFRGQLMLISQADGEMIFASSPSSPALTELKLSDGPTKAFPTGENLPPLDGFAVATADAGTLYVVDSKGGNGANGSITALHTGGWDEGTVFVAEPSDNGNQLIGTLNLHTGKVTPLGNTFANPKELLFVPSGDEQ